ncbi:MAG: hypothetical protein ACYC0Y_21975 [Pirellulales bacterium]
MQARELVELAALVSAHGPVLIHGAGRAPATSIGQYGTASKCRLDRWSRSLRVLERMAAESPATQADAAWGPLSGVFEEILTGEVLTRVWTAVVCAADRTHGWDDVEPVVQSVLGGHLETRNRVLNFLVRGQGVSGEHGAILDRLRRRTERWSDLLIGYLMGAYDVSDFAIDPVRAKDFSEDLRYQGPLPHGEQAWSLVLASLRMAFQQGLSPTSPNADLNARIAASILSCFQPEMFDATGLFRSLWLARLLNTANDAQGMIDDLLAVENAESAPRRR